MTAIPSGVNIDSATGETLGSFDTAQTLSTVATSTISGLPADFGNMNTVELYQQWEFVPSAGTIDDDWACYVIIYSSDLGGVAAGVDAVLAASSQSTTAHLLGPSTWAGRTVNSYYYDTVTMPWVNTTASKSDWESGFIEWHWTWSKNMGVDTIRPHIIDTTITTNSTYTQASSTDFTGWGILAAIG